MTACQYLSNISASPTEETNRPSKKSLSTDTPPTDLTLAKQPETTDQTTNH